MTDDTIWKISGKLLGKPGKIDPVDAKKARKADDISGIACTTEPGFPRICLVADDESQGVQIAILHDGELRAGSVIRLIDAAHHGRPLELDAEGVAYDGDAFYVIGSHGRPRHEANVDDAAEIEARAAATRNLFRIRFAPDAIDRGTGVLTGQPTITNVRTLPRILGAIPELRPFVDKPLEQGGLTIEGVAVRGTQLLIGLRGPVLDDGNAVIVSIPLKALFDGEATKGTLNKVQLGLDSRGRKRGVRDLAAMLDGVLILAGPMLDPKDDTVEAGDYTVFSWDGAGSVRKRLDLPAYGDAVKPEALLPLDRTENSLRALVFFDGPDEGAPRSIAIPL